MSEDMHKILLMKFNDKLKENNIHLTIYTVGGFALKCHNLKGVTYDIDAFYISNNEIEESIKEVETDEIKPFLKNGEHWLNQAVNYLKDPNVKNPGKENSSIFLSLSNLKVYIANEDYLLVMKIIAYHDRKEIEIKHLNDIKNILKYNRHFNSEKVIEDLFYKFDVSPDEYYEDIQTILKESDYYNR